MVVELEAAASEDHRRGAEEKRKKRKNRKDRAAIAAVES
jgi:hypothetical protein